MERRASRSDEPPRHQILLTASSEFAPGRRYQGIVAGDDVTVIAVDVHGASSATVTYRGSDGGLGECLVNSSDSRRVSEIAQRRWTFDADGAIFRLASEARGMKWAHLAVPFAAVDTSNIDPHPHRSTERTDRR